MAYLQVIDQQLIEGGVSVQVDQETLVVDHPDARRLQRDAQTLQLLLTLLSQQRGEMETSSSTQSVLLVDPQIS